jgi:lipopolysaccharide O-acetyltransferase
VKIRVARVLRAVSLINSARNRLLNLGARVLSGQGVAIDWRGIKIVHPERISIGDHFSSGKGLWLESVEGRGEIKIGCDVNFSDNVHVGCANRIVIEDGVLVGSKALIIDHSHGRTGAESLQELSLNPNMREIVSKGEVYIGPRVWIGDGVCILPGCSIGEAAIIGANAVVNCVVPPRSIWAGIPARQIWPHRKSAR